MDQLVGPCLQHEDPDIKRDAVKCVGMCSLITKVFKPPLLEYPSNSKPSLLQPSAGAGLAGCLFSITSQDTAPDTRVVLYQTLFDLLMRYGKAIFKFPTSFNPPVTVSNVAVGPPLLSYNNVVGEPREGPSPAAWGGRRFVDSHCPL
jgi:hypothetical protein